MKKRMSARPGFTLIELLVVIGLIGLLAAVVLIAVNPARQFALGRDSQRAGHVNAVLNAIGQNIAENQGNFTCATGSLPSTATKIGTGAGNINLTCLVPTFISDLPLDPGGAGTAGTAADTQYTVMRDSTTQRITVAAPNTEIETPDISATR